MKESTQTLADIARKKRQLYLVEKLHAGKALSVQEIKELEQLDALPLKAHIVKDEGDAARYFGVSSRTIRRWRREGMPLGKDGLYDLKKIESWRKKKDEKYRSPFKQEKDQWEVQIAAHKAALLELELKKATGEVISRDEVEKDMIAKILAVKQALLALPTRLAPLLAMKSPREIEPVIYEAVCEILDTFAGVRAHQEQWDYGQHPLD